MLICSLFAVFLLIAGCVGPTPPTPPLPNITPGKTCTNVSSTTPYVTVDCSNTTSVNEKCEFKKLDYTLTDIDKLQICTLKDSCIGYDSKGKCVNYQCSKQTTICKLNITNNDDKFTGQWTVSGNFTMNGIVFDKNPDTVSIAPKGTATVTFQQFYNIDNNNNQLLAECAMYISSSPKIYHCMNITTTTEDCKNVTKYKTMTKEVCK